jgi:radical SAM-linked protein
MILFKYTKTDGAEYISHLDMIRHIGRTLKRAAIDVNLSEGFNKHSRIYLSAPIGVGLKSLSEFCTVETDFDAEKFAERFNEFSPKGIKCVSAVFVEKNPNIAGIITSAEYEITGINYFNENEILDKESIIITDKRGKIKDIRDKIIDIKQKDGILYAKLKFGNDNLRADLFAEMLLNIYGGKIIGIIKTKAFAKELLL